METSASHPSPRVVPAVMSIVGLSHPGFRQQPVFLLRTLGSVKALERGRGGHLTRTVRDLGCKPSSGAIAAWLTLAK